MELFDWFRFKRQPIPEPEPPRRPLMELADECFAWKSLSGRSLQEVRELGHRLGKLMVKHSIEYIARKDCLIRQRISWTGKYIVRIEPLPMRLDAPEFSENIPATHLIPLVDRLLEADAGYGRDEERCRAAGEELAKAMQVKGHDLFLHQGYRFERIGTFC